MILRYSIEFTNIAQQGIKYQPIGVWVQGPAKGIDLYIQYISGVPDEKKVGKKIIQNLEKKKNKKDFSLPHDFLEYWHEQLPSYIGDLSYPRLTKRFKTKKECAFAVLALIKAGRIK